MKTIKQTHRHTILKAAKVIKTIPFSKATIKLQAISAVSYSTINKVSEVFNIANTTLKFWIKTFEKSGIEGLESKVKNPNKPILYFSESRFGTRAKNGLGCFIKGSRAPVKVKLGLIIFIFT